MGTGQQRLAGEEAGEQGTAVGIPREGSAEAFADLNKRLEKFENRDPTPKGSH